MKFIIKDWTNKTCFHGKTFNTFEDAWEYIYEKDPMSEPLEENEHYYDDYCVEQT